MPNIDIGRTDESEQRVPSTSTKNQFEEMSEEMDKICELLFKTVEDMSSHYYEIHEKKLLADKEEEIKKKEKIKKQLNIQELLSDNLKDKLLKPNKNQNFGGNDINNNNNYYYCEVCHKKFKSNYGKEAHCRDKNHYL